MSRSTYLKPDTVALHSGYVPESDHGSRAVPVYQTTSYVLDSVSDGSSLFKGLVDTALSDLYVVPSYKTAFLSPFDERFVHQLEE